MPTKTTDNSIKHPVAYAALAEAIALAGGQTALASAITDDQKTITQGHIYNWIARDHRCSPTYVLKVEKATGVSRHRLRPDLYPIECTA